MNADTLLNILPLSRNVSTVMRNIFISSVFLWSVMASKTLQYNRKILCPNIQNFEDYCLESFLVFNGVLVRCFHFRVSY